MSKNQNQELFSMELKNKTKQNRSITLANHKEHIDNLVNQSNLKLTTITQA